MSLPLLPLLVPSIVHNPVHQEVFVVRFGTLASVRHIPKENAIGNMKRIPIHNHRKVKERTKERIGVVLVPVLVPNLLVKAMVNVASLLVAFLLQERKIVPHVVLG